MGPGSGSTLLGPLQVRPGARQALRATRLPYFFSDQYDVGLEYVGLHDPSDELVVRGSFDEGKYQALWIASDGTLSAGMHVNDRDAMGPIRALVEGRAATDAAQLADPDHSLLHERHAA